MTNSLIFDQTYLHEDAEYQQHVGTKVFIQHEDKERLTGKFLFEQITSQTIEMLRFLVSRGADPTAKVGKIKFYRELDAHKKQIAVLTVQREAMQIGNQAQQEVIDTSSKSLNNTEVKTRDEAMALQKTDKKGKK